MLKLAKLCCMFFGVFAMLNGCAFTPHHEDLAQPIENRQVLSDRVQANLASAAELKGLRISVGVFRDVVSLRGRVHTVAQKQLALEIAKQTNGVGAVKDQLLVKK
jgi:osmotically-inducible protein OsmY